MDGFGVNTYRLVNAASEGVLVKFHWKTQQGLKSLNQAQAEAIQATDLGHASKDPSMRRSSAATTQAGSSASRS